VRGTSGQFPARRGAGRALLDLASSRPDPIAFYGEPGSTNPVVVTPRGWAHRPDDIASGVAGSVTSLPGSV
jgi:NADP-dependent aldehyde dehydrogenase